MTGSRLIDSSLWLSYLINGDHKDIIDTEGILLLSALSLFEIKRKLLKEKLSSPVIEKRLDFIRRKSLIINADTAIADKAADLAIAHDLPAMDAIIYASALLNNAIVLTLDNDFKGLEKAQVLH